ncbi:MAG TPA: hypothetical protein VGI97_08650 [Gemmatimonadaceae bacterium]
MRRIIALLLLVTALPATSFAQVTFQSGQASDRPRPPVTIVLGPASPRQLPVLPPLGYPRLPGTMVLPHQPFARPIFVPPPPRPMRPLSFRARVVTGVIAGFLIGGTFGVPSVSQSCGYGFQATGPCRAGSALLGSAMGGVAGAISWLGRN